MLSKDKVLVVDSSSPARAAIINILRDQLFCKDIIESNDGQDALRKIQRISNLDWVFCDWDLPNLTGLEILKDIRSNPETAHLPFIMVTAKSDRDSLVAAVQEGVTSFIIKPFTAKKLVEKVYIARGRLERRNAERTKVAQEKLINLNLATNVAISAKLIDISLSGFLCLAKFDDINDLKVFDNLSLATDLNLNLPCQTIRLEADPNHPARTSHLRLAARFLPMQEDQRRQLVSFIEGLAKTK